MTISGTAILTVCKEATRRPWRICSTNTECFMTRPSLRQVWTPSTWKAEMAVEMMFHHKFGFNGGPFPIHSVKYVDGNTVWYFITYHEHVVPVTAFLSEGG